jgi:hypothetical protein
MSCIGIPASLIGLAQALSGLLLFSAGSAAQSFQITSIDVPCSACPGGIASATSAQGINPAGDIVGAYVDAAGRQHGFLLSHGQFTTIDVPEDLPSVAGTTTAAAINPSGDIVGNYKAPVNTAVAFGSPDYCTPAHPATCTKGFLYSRGKFSRVLFPLPSGGYHPGAVPRRITPDGNIYGCLHDDDLGMSMFGAVWTRLGDFNLTAGGGELASSEPLAATGVPMSMNNGATPDGHTVVGHWTDMMTPGHTHGFIVQNGDFHVYDVPGSAATVIWDINPAGAFVGFYRDTRNHGFLQLPDGSPPIAIDPPDSVGAQAFGINPGGVIVGQYTDAGHHLHGFLAVPMVSY